MNPSSIHVPAAALPEIETLYEQGRYVTAHALAVQRHGPLEHWSGDVEALILGNRLAGNVGGERASYVLSLRACRAVAAGPASQRAEVALFHGYRIYGRRGPLALRRFLGRRSVRAAFEEGATDTTRANVLCLRAHVAAAFRDTDAAEADWQAAHALAADRAWTWCERASLLTAADRYPEALEAAHESLRLHPWYRPAVQQAAQILTLLERDEEAMALLESSLDPAVGALESPAVAAQLALIYAELFRPQEVLRALERYESLSPMQEDAGRLWVAQRRSEALLQLGDLAGSADAAELLAATQFFYEKTVGRLRDPARQAARHVVLAVPFVRQHERTCAPATLAALSQFWGRPADHLAIAREICYGGTFDHQERHWAETHGWTVREFRVDWEGAVALIDAGVPFTLATAGTNSGHLQAVIGYDGRRGTLVIRDPYERNQREWLAEEFFEQHGFHGPRGMALVPSNDAGASVGLEAMALPETAFYDGLYRLRRALHRHDRPGAHAALEELQALDPGARLTLAAQRELAYYDGDDPGVLAVAERLLALFPKESRLRMEKLYVLRRLARPAEARAWLESCAAADSAHLEPNLWRELARELAVDARQRPRARLLLARSLFYEPTEAAHLRALGNVCWDERDFSEAGALFRLAATAAAVQEDHWQHYFVACRHLGQTDEALRLLDDRFRRLGDRSSQPARTLHWARRERHEFGPAAAVLSEALARRREDGDLLLFAAVAHARDGEHAGARRLLEAATVRAAPGAYSRAAAELATLAGDLTGALGHWREVLAREPLDAAAHRQAARLLAETDPRGPAAEREHLDAAVGRFPHATALHELRIESLIKDTGRGTAEHTAAVAAVLAVQPANVWAHREKALGLAEGHDLPAALAALEEAGRLDPLAPPTHALRGYLLLRSGRVDEAQASLRQALELDVDCPGALASLLQSSPTLADKRAALAFVHAQLVRQPFVGPGILTYRDAAYPILEEAELSSQLDLILAARPDVWQAWSATVGQHADAARPDAARARAQAAVERFPLLPRVWMDLAVVERIRGDDPAQVTALERALRIDSANGEASRALALAHRLAGRFPAARTTLEQAVAAAPLDVFIRGSLAETLWLEDRATHGARVLEILTDAVRREPGYEWGWNFLARCARTLEEPAVCESAARGLTTTRPGEARSWLRLALTLEGAPALPERLDALARALALNPRSTDAYDLRAVLLSDAGRYDEALAACEPSQEAYPGNTRPFTLDGRAAWVLARRGDLTAARERMRTVLADHPSYQWGWQMLSDWAEAAGDKQENLTAAERLAFLTPHTALPLGYLASAHLALKQRGKAKAALKEAMRRDPTYLYAPATLLTIQLEDKEFVEGEETLRFLEKHHPGPPTLGRTVLLATKRRQKPRALAALGELAQQRPAPGVDNGNLPEAVRTVLGAGWSDVAEEALQLALHAPLTSNPEAGAVWVRSRVERNRWGGVGKTVRRLPEGELARRARTAWLGVLTERRHRWDVWWSVWLMDRSLRADTESWGQTGYALTGCGYYRRTVRWMSDWTTHSGVQSWMLMNLATSLRHLHRHRDALAIHRHSLTLPPDQSRPKHAVWVALEDALADDDAAHERARRLYEEVARPVEKLAQPFRYLGVLLGQVLAVRAAGDPAQRRAVFHGAMQTLRTERRTVARTFRTSNQGTYRAERRAKLRMAADADARWHRFALRVFSPPISGSAQFVFFTLWILVLAALMTAAIVGLVLSTDHR